MILRRETSWEFRHIWRSYHHQDVNYVQWFMATIGLFFCWYSRFSILKSDDEFNLLPYFFRWLDTNNSHCTDFRCNKNSYFQDWNIRRVIEQPGTWGPWWTVNFLVSHGHIFRKCKHFWRWCSNPSKNVRNKSRGMMLDLLIDKQLWKITILNRQAP